MKIAIVAIGRLKRGPEREIAERLLSRAATAAKQFGIVFDTREIAESRAATAEQRADQEAAAILATISDKTVLVALDERGKTIDSRAFAGHVEKWRGDGVADVVFTIGGADGHGAALLKRANLRLAFGAMTWPHQLVRLMLAEQLYRSITILLGHPYHRG